MECPICFETNESITFSCEHSICIRCYQSIIEKEDVIKCPMCRLVIEEFIPLQITQIAQLQPTNPNYMEDRRIASGCGICTGLLVIAIIYFFVIHK